MACPALAAMFPVAALAVRVTELPVALVTVYPVRILTVLIVVSPVTVFAPVNELPVRPVVLLPVS